MYQFYYAQKNEPCPRRQWKENIRNQFRITAVRPAMWEEHCLECSAPVCFESCAHYAPRSDGRCKRFENGLRTFPEERACCGQGVHVKFRRWGNMMTIAFPAMLPETEYQALYQKNEALGRKLRKIADSSLPQSLRWQTIRTVEYLRRRKLRKLAGGENKPDAFLFHGFSYGEMEYRLILEVYDDHTPVFKTALEIHPGENLQILPGPALGLACARAGYLVKIYPENNLEAELDILWCDFVQGAPRRAEKPADTVKCVVWDLDGTLWDGTLVETEDPAQLTLRPGVLDVIRALDSRGIIQSVASKNDYETAWPQLERLGVAEYFLYPQIHWNAKSGSVEQIAKCFNIGIDALAFVDDTAFEREQVRSVWPQVRTYDITALPDLLERPEFCVPVTEESRNRRPMYRAEERRRESQAAGHVDTVEFLRGCHLKMKLFTPASEEEKKRCYELVVRTNQLNMSGKKYTPEEFAQVLERPDHRNFAFSCGDDFGEYGIVGFGQYRVEDSRLVFTEFAMSCRVAGKFVESALFTALLKQEACTEGLFPVVETKKNVLLRNTLEQIGVVKAAEYGNVLQYTFAGELSNWNLVNIERN